MKRVWQEYRPELADISRRKCSDVLDGAGGTVTLRKINRTDDDFV